MNLSFPNCFSSNNFQVPNYFSSKEFTFVCIIPPVALPTLLRSSSGTLPAENNPLSAKYWVAKSPIGNFDKTTWAPDLIILSKF